MADSKTLMRSKSKILGAEITDALLVLARNGGNLAATQRETDIPSSTLHGWRERYKDEYTNLAERLQASIEQEQIVEWSEVTSLANQVARKGLERGLERLDADKDNMPVTTAQRAMITGATSYDKKRLAQDRPTQITAINPEETIKALKRKLIEYNVVDAKVVEELPPAA